MEHEILPSSPESGVKQGSDFLVPPVKLAAGQLESKSETSMTTAEDDGKLLLREIMVECSPSHSSNASLDTLEMLVMGPKGSTEDLPCLQRILPTTWKHNEVYELERDEGELVFLVRSKEAGDLGYLILTPKDIVEYTASDEEVKQVSTETRVPRLWLHLQVDIEPDQVASFKFIFSLLPDNPPWSHPVDRPGNMTDMTAGSGHYKLGESFRDRFDETTNLFDLSDAIDHLRKALWFTPDDHEEMALRSHELGSALFDRFNQTDNLSDLTEAIAYHEKAVLRAPDGFVDLPRWLNTLGQSLSARHGKLNNLADITNAIKHQRRAVLLSEGGANLPWFLNNLGDSLSRHFEQEGKLGDIDEAIEHQKKALLLAPEGHANLPSLLSNLGSSFSSRYDQTENLADINTAIEYEQKALRLTVEGHSNMPERLDNLGCSFSNRFVQTGDLIDITNAIEYQRKAVALTPDGSDKLPLRLSNLAAGFTRWFDQTGNLTAVAEAIEYQERVIRLLPDGDPDLPLWLSHLGSSLSRRFDHTHDLADISRAIEYQQRAVELTPPDHSDIPVLLTNLGSSFSRRYDKTGSLTDIANAVKSLEQAVVLTPEGHARLPSRLNSLGASFTCRFEHAGEVADITKSIECKQKAVLLTPTGHADRPIWLANVGNSLLQRFERTRVEADRQEARRNFRAAANSWARPATRIMAARSWARCSMELADQDDAMEAFGVALELMSFVASMDQTIDNRHTSLQDISDLATEAVVSALTAGSPEKALEWLEQGRCLVWTQLNQLRTPLDVLRDHNASLAGKFVSISRGLDPSGLDAQDDIHTSLKLAQEWTQLLSKIRGLPGFDDFLCPPKTASILSQLPIDGPVVIISVHTKRCDALALVHEEDKVHHIPLDNFTFEKAEVFRTYLRNHLTAKGLRIRDNRAVKRRHTDSTDSHPLRDILRDLWTGVVQPILQGLGYSSPPPQASRPHIRWCVTGPLAFLPIHAAGVYGQEIRSPGSCVSDFVVSSYIPTVGTLLEKLKESRSSSPLKTKILLFSQPATPGQTLIPATTEETQTILKRMEANGIEATWLEGAEVTKGRGQQEMRTHGWVHFACHACQDAKNALKSGFSLHDGRLELLDIIKHRLPTAEFAFLSACQTSVGDEKLSEEAVHIAAGMLAAGYRGVVATMWGIKDAIAPKIADDFYSNLLEGREDSEDGRIDSRRAPHALDYAIQKARARLGEQDDALMKWVPYIHFGL